MKLTLAIEVIEGAIAEFNGAGHKGLPHELDEDPNEWDIRDLTVALDEELVDADILLSEDD